MEEGWPFDGTTWGAILQVTANGQLPRVATNGTRWVISFVEPGTPDRAFAASWTEAGGVTVPQQLSTLGTAAVVQDTGVASAAGSFYATWDEGAPIKSRFSDAGQQLVLQRHPEGGRLRRQLRGQLELRELHVHRGAG